MEMKYKKMMILTVRWKLKVELHSYSKEHLGRQLLLHSEKEKKIAANKA